MSIKQRDIVSHAEMCAAEKRNLQQGMNFRPGGRRSVILMSLRKGAPYADRVEDDGVFRLVDEWRETSEIKLAVWKRDGGQCVQCGATDNLHFDHVLPFSKGGSSLLAENVQLLCARHNLRKSASIQ